MKTVQFGGVIKKTSVCFCRTTILAVYTRDTFVLNVISKRQIQCMHIYAWYYSLIIIYRILLCTEKLLLTNLRSRIITRFYCDDVLIANMSLETSFRLSYYLLLFLRASAMLKHVIDIGWTSVCLSVCPSVCHTLALYQNGSTYCHNLFTTR